MIGEAQNYLKKQWIIPSFFVVIIKDTASKVPARG